MLQTINVIEPTLTSEAGHCYNFINAFCKASDESRTLCLWINRQAEISFAEKNIQIKKHFFRRVRRLQSYLLYRKLLATPEKLFVSTAGHLDLLMADWASNGVLPPEKIYFYFHWFNSSNRKLASLRKVARKQPHLVILGPTPSVVKIFQDAGFCNAHIVPYPISKQAMNHQVEPGNFKHLLYAGAARQDKGFSHVVDLVLYLNERGLKIPIVMQTSPDHYGKHDATIQADIQRLRAIAYPHLELCPDTLNASEYANLFTGAICLQLYSQSDFSDRVSGVTLDAFSFGSPIVAAAETWMSRKAQRFDAGATVEDTSPPHVLSVVQHMIDNYPRYNMHALAAGKILQEENSAKALYRVLAGQH